MNTPWLLFSLEDINYKRNIQNKLEQLGFENSKYSTDLNTSKGIALFYDGNQKVYILCSSSMISDDERMSWVLHREKFIDEHLFLNYTMDWLKVCSEFFNNK